MKEIVKILRNPKLAQLWPETTVCQIHISSSRTSPCVLADINSCFAVLVEARAIKCTWRFNVSALGVVLKKEKKGKGLVGREGGRGWSMSEVEFFFSLFIIHHNNLPIP